MKREPKVKAKPGELRVAWGRDEDGEGPCLIYAHGTGCQRAGASLLATVFEHTPFSDLPTLVAELERRNYDITTLKFSIQKKAEVQP